MFYPYRSKSVTRVLLLAGFHGSQTKWPQLRPSRPGISDIPKVAQEDTILGGLFGKRVEGVRYFTAAGVFDGYTIVRQKRDGLTEVVKCRSREMATMVAREAAAWARIRQRKKWLLLQPNLRPVRKPPKPPGPNRKIS
jgi:hypothetical protein